MSKKKILEKMASLFKEELWGRIEPKDIGISKFKILDDLFNFIVSENLIEETLGVCKENLEVHPDSITAIYLIGLCGYHLDRLEDAVYLRKLTDLFIDSHKWAVVERISEKILEYGENSSALRSLAISLERLGRSKEAIPVFENLLKIDRFDAEVAKKLAFAIIEDDSEKSIYYMKLSIEGFIKNKEYDEVSSLWNKLVSVSWEDIVFFERIERLLVEAKQYDLVSVLLKSLLAKYKDEDNPEQSIELLKKILKYKFDDTHLRRELINLYRIKYGEHSQFDQFMKLSKLNNFKTPVKYAIQDFEKNIIFDKGNYAYHNSWGLGKIDDIDSDGIVINFSEKENHKMSIKMALQSLTPIGSDHVYVLEYEDPETIKELFKEDFIEFFKILIKSYDGKILLSDIKSDLIPKYVEAKNWTKWWSKARTIIKKDPLFGVSEKKKDLIFLRDKPVTFADELLGNFTKSDSFSDKLDIAIEFINNIEKDEGSSVFQYFIDYFIEQTKGNSATRMMLSYFILKDFGKYVDSKKFKFDSIQTKVNEFIKHSQELPIISMKIGSYDYKKDFVNLISEIREDWTQVYAELLFETPVRIHKYIINNLIRAHSYNVINSFIDRTITGAKQFPEIFIWIAKNLYTGTWDYDWLDYSRERLTLTYFRLMNELKKIEINGNRLKNIIIDILFDNDGFVVKDIIENFDEAFISKVYDLYSNVSYISEADISKFLSIITDKYTNFQVANSQSDDEWKIDIERLIVSEEGYKRMKEEYDRLVNVELVNISRELGKVSEASPDIRENIEYNALMEKHSILELAITKLDDEIKKADIIDIANISTDVVDIGTIVIINDIEKNEKDEYAVLGPWDADFEKKILSYRSPIAKALLGKRKGDEVSMKIDDENRKFKVESIDIYKSLKS